MYLKVQYYNTVNELDKKLNSGKEKKLNAIKSEILAITDFAKSKFNDQNSNINRDYKIEDISNDTITLTNIVENKDAENNDLIDIKNEIYQLKSILINQEIVLREILTKIK